MQNYIIGECILTVRSPSECRKFGQIRYFTRLGGAGAMQCFSFEHTINDTIDEVFIALNNSIHPYGIRSEYGGFYVMFHYPHQITMGLPNLFTQWPLRSNAMENYYVMAFLISNVEILKRRNDGSKQCYDWKEYDTTFIEDVMAAVGCRPPYWKTKNSHPACLSQKNLRDSKAHFLVKMVRNELFQKYVPPCIEITKMDVRYEEQPGKLVRDRVPDVMKKFESTAGTTKGWFVINTHFWKSVYFKQMSTVKAYTFQSMIGNSGGYIGLLVGITISDLPCFLCKLYFAIKGMVLGYNNS